MLYSRLLGNDTQRQTSRKNQMISHNLLLQGGYIKTAGQGFHTFMPMGMLVSRNLMQIIREELEMLDGQEVCLPLTVPLSLFEKTGRDAVLERDIVTFQDRSGRILVPAPSHIESMVDLVKQSTRSWKDFPKLLFQFQRKFRDELRLTGGITRGQEFLMSDAYSFHRNFTDLNNFFPKIYQAYKNIFSRCQIPVVSAESAVGSLSGYKAYEFLYPHPEGRDILLTCSSCGYTANQDVAIGYKNWITEIPEPLEVVKTENCRDSIKVAEYLGVELSRVAKTIVYKTRDGFAVAVIRADYEISLEKLSRFLMIPVIRLASPSELTELGFNLGSLSPLGMEHLGLPIAVDDAVANGNNFIIGTNEEDRYYKNVNFGRDFESELVGDLVRLKEGDRCFQCNSQLDVRHALELGNIFKLGEYYSRTMGLHFRNDAGQRQYPNMGSYGIGIERLMAAVVEENHDDKGIIWPVAIAPFKFYLMGIGYSLKIQETTRELYRRLEGEVLLDDRQESPGVKFQDMDLLGIPYRIVVSAKSLADGNVEFYERRTGRIWTVPLENARQEALRLIRNGKADSGEDPLSGPEIPADRKV